MSSTRCSSLFSLSLVDWISAYTVSEGQPERTRVTDFSGNQLTLVIIKSDRITDLAQAQLLPNYGKTRSGNFAYFTNKSPLGRH
jgi:hypothetical protein